MSITLRTFKSSETFICHFWVWQRCWNLKLDPLKFQYAKWCYQINMQCSYLKLTFFLPLFLLLLNGLAMQMRIIISVTSNIIIHIWITYISFLKHLFKFLNMYCNILMLQNKNGVHVVCKLPSLLIIKITATYTCKCNCIQQIWLVHFVLSTEVHFIIMIY